MTLVAESPVQQTRVPFPFPNALECRHDQSGRPYLLQQGTSLWWTRDTAGHGGIVFKTYRRLGDVLVHQADRDGEGDEVPGKFKGEAGREVALGELTACSHPHTHLDL